MTQKTILERIATDVAITTKDHLANQVVRERDNRDENEMYKSYDARIEAMKRRISELERQNAEMKTMIAQLQQQELGS